MPLAYILKDNKLKCNKTGVCQFGAEFHLPENKDYANIQYHNNPRAYFDGGLILNRESIAISTQHSVSELKRRIDMDFLEIGKVVFLPDGCCGDYYLVSGTRNGKPFEKEVPADGLEGEPKEIYLAILAHGNSQLRQHEEELLDRLWG